MSGITVFWLNPVVLSVHVFRVLYSLVSSYCSFLDRSLRDINSFDFRIIKASRKPGSTTAINTLVRENARWPTPAPSQHGLISYAPCGVRLAIVQVWNERSCCWRTVSSPTHPVYFFFHSHVWVQDGPIIHFITGLSALFDWPCLSASLVYSTPTPCIRSIDAMYVGCRYPGAAADRLPRAPPSKHPGTAKRSRGLIAATPGSSPLSMRLGIWSRWVGKHEKPQPRKNAPPNRVPTGWWKKRKEGKKCGWAWPWRIPPCCADRQSRDLPPLPYQATLVPLLPSSHAVGRRRSGQPH